MEQKSTHTHTPKTGEKCTISRLRRAKYTSSLASTVKAQCVCVPNLKWPLATTFVQYLPFFKDTHTHHLHPSPVPRCERQPDGEHHLHRGSGGGGGALRSPGLLLPDQPDVRDGGQHLGGGVRSGGAGGVGPVTAAAQVSSELWRAGRNLLSTGPEAGNRCWVSSREGDRQAANW